MAALRTFCVLVSCVVACAAPGRCRAEDISKARAALYANYAQQLTELADWCDKEALGSQSQQTRAWLPQRDAGKLYLFYLPQSGPAHAPDGPPNSKLDEWHTRFGKLREVQADALFDLARRAIAAHRPSLALELVQEAARENPDHKEARRLLGYLRYHDEWHTPFEVRQLGADKIWHEKFGWLPKTHVARYENGERFYRGRWISADDDSRLHASINKGWRIESDHYAVTTNHSLEEGVQLSKRLERLYGVWQVVFIRYLANEAELARRFDGHPARSRDARQHNVTYYRTRDEYNEALRPQQPKIDITLGIYFDDGRAAFFFADKDQQPGTLYHEATHQLFQETRNVAKEVGRRDNFWIIEAIACYMESLCEHESYCTLGGLDQGRLPAARQRLLVDQFYVPLAELVGYGMNDLQSDARIAPLYSQASGLADFLMHAGDGQYREALLGYLEAVYTGRATKQTLAELTGRSYEQLDREYRAFLQH